MLNGRLKEVYDYLEPNMSLADIGCDHGYLCIEYAKNNDAKVLAVDNKIGPLNSCKENVYNFGLENKIVFSFSNGIEAIDESIKQIAIAGMGGNNIIDIINGNLNCALKLKNIVLCPNCNCYELRKFLVNNKFEIINEKLIKENDLIYEVLKVKPGKQNLSYKELYFGPYILKQKGEFFIEKYQGYMIFLESLLEKIPNNLSNKIKIENLNNEINLIKEELK